MDTANKTPELVGKMVNFPTVVADDFYPDPYAIKKIATRLEYRKDLKGAFPGKRTMPLHMVDQALDQFCNIRFLSLYFDVAQNADMQWAISSYFQLVDPIAPQDNPLNKGWTHVDTNSILAGVVYLDQNADTSSGTNLYRAKENIDPSIADDATNARREFYKTGTAMPGYEQALNEHNSKFTESVVVKNYYNRIVAYDAHVWHRANTHYTGTGPRLTQVFFVNDLKNATSTPYERLKALPSLEEIRRQMQPKLSFFNGKLKLGQ